MEPTIRMDHDPPPFQGHADEIPSSPTVADVPPAKPTCMPSEAAKGPSKSDQGPSKTGGKKTCRKRRIHDEKGGSSGHGETSGQSSQIKKTKHGNVTVWTLPEDDDEIVEGYLLPPDDPVSYPAHLFEDVPSKLKIDALRKKVMISQIEAARATTLFYRQIGTLIGPTKNSLSSFPKPSAAKENNDHDYNFPDVS